MHSSLAPIETTSKPQFEQNQLPTAEARKLRKLMKSGYNSALLGAAWRLAEAYPLAELPRIVLARAFLQERDTKSALTQIEGIAAHAGASPQVLEIYAKALDAHGRLEAALDVLDRFCDRFSEAATAQILAHKATVHLRLGDRLAARRSAAQAIAVENTAALALEVFSATLEIGDRLEEELEKSALFHAIASYSANTTIAQALACDLIFAELSEISKEAQGELVLPAPLVARLAILAAHGVICHLGLEAISIVLRKSLLEMVGSGQPLSGADRALAEGLARHSFTNEFLWPESAEETVALEALQVDIIAGLKTGQAIEYEKFLALAAYRDLSRIDAVRTWVASAAAKAASAKKGFDPTLRKIVLEPLIEEQLAQNMPALTEIDDVTSNAVRAQYEEHPYPRWSTLPKTRPQLYLDHIGGEIYPNAAGLKDGLKDGVQSPRVLVAGCGTGQHPISVALSYADAQVMAVDLSCASLAYAAREAHARSIANIVFAQGDILKLGAMGPQFDVVEAIGVLHHMARPEDGLAALLKTLKPGGLMHLGLYSQLARQDVRTARAQIETGAFEADLAGIRAFRAAYLEAPGEPTSDLARLRDFYNTSELRDLVFHVQEHQFTMPAVAEILERHGLEFLGFAELPDETRAAYGAAFPDDETQTNLGNWAVFEAANPETFRCMYRFWCRKAET